MGQQWGLPNLYEKEQKDERSMPRSQKLLVFCLFFISLFPVMGYAEEILYDSGQEKSVSQKTPDTSRVSDTKKGQSEDPVLPATSNADKIRVSLGAGYYAMIGSSGVGHSLSLLVGVDFRLASIYRMGLEAVFIFRLRKIKMTAFMYLRHFGRTNSFI